MTTKTAAPRQNRWSENTALEFISRMGVAVTEKTVYYKSNEGLRVWSAIDYLEGVHKYRVMPMPKVNK